MRTHTYLYRARQRPCLDIYISKTSQKKCRQHYKQDMQTVPAKDPAQTSIVPASAKDPHGHQYIKKPPKHPSTDTKIFINNRNTQHRQSVRQQHIQKQSRHPARRPIYPEPPKRLAAKEIRFTKYNCRHFTFQE